MNAQNDFLTGQKSFLDGNFRKSIASFSSALEHGLEPEKGYLALGMAHLRNGDFVDAVEDFSHTLEFNDHNELALFYRGIAHLNHADLQETIDDLSEVLTLHPEKTEALIARFLVFKEMHKEEEAEAAMRLALSLSGVEVEEFMRNYVLSPKLYNKALILFDVREEPWAVKLGEERRRAWN
ncbi:MAG: hypothetical protein ABFS09_03375 [Thermodesulfobacteriota bacterium]